MYFTKKTPGIGVIICISVAGKIVADAAFTSANIARSLSAKSPPLPPPPHLVAQSLPGSSDTPTPEQSKQRLDSQVDNVSDPNGPLAREVASAEYKGYSIQRTAQLGLISELIQSEIANLSFGHTLSDPLKVQKLAQSLVASIRQASTEAEANLKASCVIRQPQERIALAHETRPFGVSLS